MLRPLLPILTALAFVAAVLPGHAAHPHYLRLLQEGTLALEQGDAEQARRDLRLACFGLLEEPPLLAECLMRLGLAQDAVGDAAELQETFRRVVEIERRFGAYGEADVPAQLRAAFEEVLTRRITDRALRTSGVFADLLEPEEEPPAGEAPGTAPSTSDGSPGPARVTERTPTDRTELGAAERAKLDRARELLEQAQRRSDLEEPYRLARQVADAHPRSLEAQRLTGVVAYRSSRWTDAVRYFQRGEVTLGDHPQLLFYYAVSLYEAGRPGEAVDPLRRSLPHLEQTPFVQSYREKILPDPEAPVQ